MMIGSRNFKGRPDKSEFIHVKLQNVHNIEKEKDL